MQGKQPPEIKHFVWKEGCQILAIPCLKSSLSGFSFKNIHNSEDLVGTGKLSLQLLSITSTNFTNI